MIKMGIALVLAIILLIPAALVGGNLAFRSFQGVDLISSAVYAAMLTESVDEAVVCPDAITHDDMMDVTDTVNNSVANMITYNNDQFSIDLEHNSTGNMNRVIKLSGKEVASLAQIVLTQEDLGQVRINDETYIDVAIKQVDFEEIDQESTRISVVMTVDVKPMKQMIRDSLNGTGAVEQKATDAARSTENTGASTSVTDIANMAIDLIPDTLYITSTFALREEGNFDYTITHEALKLNNLTSDKTAVLFTAVNYFSMLGDAQYFNEQIALALASALIGTPDDSQDTGFAESLKDLGATDYDFVTENGVTYFTIVR